MGAEYRQRHDFCRIGEGMMRKNHPKVGDKRIQTNFLLFPKRVGYETRWLEVASWEEEFVRYFLPHTLHGDCYWTSTRWIN